MSLLRNSERELSRLLEPQALLFFKALPYSLPINFECPHIKYYIYIYTHTHTYIYTQKNGTNLIFFSVKYLDFK